MALGRTSPPSSNRRRCVLSPDPGEIHPSVRPPYGYRKLGRVPTEPSSRPSGDTGTAVGPMNPGVPRRHRSLDGPRLHRVTFRASDAEVAELARRAKAAGISVARYVAAAALEQHETASERRLWATEVGRAERIMWTAAVGIDTLLARGDAGGLVTEEAAQVLAALRQAAESVVAMGRAASQP